MKFMNSGGYSVASGDYESDNGGSKEDTCTLSKRHQILFIFALVFANFAEAACYSLQAPFFPAVAEQKGASPAIYGFIFGVIEITILVSSPFFGKLVAFFSGNVLMQTGLAVAAVSIISFGFTIYLPSGWIFITACLVIRIIDGLGISLYFTSSYSSMAKTFPDRIALVFGFLEVAFSLGSTLGPTLGGFLYEIGGYAFPFMILGALLFIAAVINHFCAPKIGIPKVRKPVSFKKFLSDFDTIVDLIGICVAFMDLGLMNVLLEPHLRQFNLTPVQLGFVFVTEGLAYAVSSPVFGYIVDFGVPPKVMNLICCPIAFLGALFLGPLPLFNFGPSIWLIVVSLILIGCGEAGRALCGFVSIKKETISRRGFLENIETYGLLTSAFFACTSIGFSIGPTIGGIVLEQYGARGTTCLMVIMNILMTILWIINFVYRARRKLSPVPEMVSEKSPETEPLLNDQTATQQLH